jgi:N-acyl-D-aspartate/D-glutamate deacylase
MPEEPILSGGMHDLVVRGATVVDGTGAAARRADVAIDGAAVTEVGRVDEGGRREVDADGLLVLPGWVDVHTHYDGQATWDQELAPSCWHGVTTTVFGNCSVGFAPVHPGSEDYLISLMEGVEDIPGSVLAEGVTFGWETFGDYLDALAASPRVMDVAAQVPHAPVRFYAMGERGADHTEVPTDDEVGEMGRLVAEALAAGALGFTTSRTVKHRAADGRYTPGLTAERRELLGIAEAMAAAGAGVVQANSDFGDAGEFALLRQMGEVSGRPVSFSLIQLDQQPEGWRELLDRVAAAAAEGIQMRGQVASRPIGILMGLEATLNPFLAHRSYQEVAGLPLAERVSRLGDPDLRQRVLAERPDGGFGGWMEHALTRTFVLGDPPNYEPDPADSVAARAKRQDVDPFELVYDMLLGDGGRALLYYPFENYADGNLDAVREMLCSPHTISGLSDGGAHVGTICDASFPTYLLTHWARDRSRGEGLPLEYVVRSQTADAAHAVGLGDRGVIAPGYRADLNLVDFDALRIAPPEMVHDLPAGGRRLVQKATGYRHTFVAGTETYADGEWTGATPGRLVRGATPTP